jgi:hypothetical protein
VDLSEEVVEELTVRYGSNPAFKAMARNVMSEKLERQFGSVLAMNVLEHVEDDVGMLKALHGVLEKDGSLVLVLPAFPSLYGPMDKMAGHFRRYTRKEIVTKARAAGFEVLEVRYFNFVGFFGWWANAKFHKPKTLSDDSINAQIKIVDKFLIPVQRVFERLMPMPVGQSLLFVARKK